MSGPFHSIGKNEFKILQELDAYYDKGRTVSELKNKTDLRDSNIRNCLKNLEEKDMIFRERLPESMDSNWVYLIDDRGVSQLKAISK